LKFLFDANQMGILDPDSLSQRWNDYLDKQSAGRILFTYWNWGYSDYNTPARTEQVKGFQPVYVNDTTIERGTGPSFIGGTWPYGVGTGTKHMDEAFKLINYYYSLDGIWTMQYGDKGVYWDLDENGKPYKTEFGWKIDDDPSLEMPNGDRPGKGISVINSCGVNLGRATHPVYGTGDSNAWVKKDFAPPDNNLVKDWKETTGIKEGSIKYLKSKGMLFEKPFAPMEPYNDEINQINLRIGDMCKTQSWLIAFAKDEAEFESLWADMAEQAKGMNLDATVKETQEMYNNAKEFGSKYAK
jgi:putative aldouronate transport system substrate-binding protein